MLLHWIWLAHRPGVGDRMKLRLLQHFQDPEDIYFADAESYRHIEGMTAEAAEGLKDKDLHAAEAALEVCRRENLHILTFRDAAYPAKLKNIGDPPIVLYYKGQLPDFDALPVVGVVGTRKASAYGMQTAKRMGYQIAKCGGIVVSGMAYGIDGLAMRGALTAGGTVVGVLGCGAEQIYPPSNRALFADTESYGCILSEFPPDRPYKCDFPVRNRLMVGLSQAVCLAETPTRSGARITARLGREENREVFALPGALSGRLHDGAHKEIQSGATLVVRATDILREYAPMFPGMLDLDAAEAMQRQVEGRKLQPPVKEKKARLKRTKKADSKASIPTEEVAPVSSVACPEAASAAAHAVYEVLSDGFTPVDELAAAAQMPIPALLAALTELEMYGCAVNGAGQQYKRS